MSNLFRCRAVPVATVGLVFFLAAPGAFAQKQKSQKPKLKPKTPVVNPSLGTQQLKGGNGVFGVVYTLKAGYNLALLKAKYTLEPHNDYNGSMPQSGEKLFVLTFAVKNPVKDANTDFPGLDLVLVDESENNYTPGAGTTRLASSGNKEIYLSLKPGQGVGQNPASDELSMAIALPEKARVKKIMINGGRATAPGEKVLRFPIAGFPEGDPKNVIEPLPKYAADPADPTGATALAVSPAVPGVYYPDGYFALKLDSVTLSGDTPLQKEKPGDGKQWAIATFTAKNIFSKQASLFDLGGEEIVLRDADNEKYAVSSGKRKATRDDEATSDTAEVGEEIRFRLFFEIPKEAKPKSITVPAGKYGHTYAFALPGS